MPVCASAFNDQLPSTPGENGSLQPQKLFTKKAGLDAANPEFLTIGENHHKCSAGNRYNPADHVQVHDRASAEANEAAWFAHADVDASVIDKLPTLRRLRD